MAKTTKKDFKLFKKECKKWIEIFGLKDWEFCFQHECVEFEGNQASCVSNVAGRLASITLFEDWGECGGISKHTIRLAAFHEVCETLLAPLNACAQSRYISAVEIEESGHAIIRRLENSLFPKY